MEYLVKTRNPKVIHLWINEDTACRMYSTGGLRNKNGYAVIKERLGLPVCTMCDNVTNSILQQNLYRTEGV